MQRAIVLMVLLIGCGAPPPTVAPAPDLRDTDEASARVEPPPAIPPEEAAPLERAQEPEQAAAAEPPPPPEWDAPPERLETREMDALFMRFGLLMAQAQRVTELVHPRRGVVFVRSYREDDELVAAADHLCPPIEPSVAHWMGGFLDSSSESDECLGYRCCTPERCCVRQGSEVETCVFFGWLDGTAYYREVRLLQRRGAPRRELAAQEAWAAEQSRALAGAQCADAR